MPGATHPDPEFHEVTDWLDRCNVAGSALGRQVCGDHSLYSRWKASAEGVSDSKRHEILYFIRTHPEGLPGYNGRGKTGNRRKTQGVSTPRDVNRVGHQPKEAGPSTGLPVPGLSELHKDDDIAWIKARAFSRGVPIAQILADMVELGIMVTKETENEE